MTVREVLRRLGRDGWYSVKAKGGHYQFKHATKPGRVTVSGKASHIVPIGTLKSIFKQAGWDDSEEDEVENESEPDEDSP